MTPATDAAREAIARIVCDIVVQITCAENASDASIHAQVDQSWHHWTGTADRILALTEAASQPREGEVYDVKCQCVDVLGPDLDCGKCSGSGYYTLRIPQRPPEQAGAVPADVRRLVIAAREVFDGAGICFPEADALDKALEPFSALVPYENQPDDPAAPTPPDAGPGEIPVGMMAWRGGDSAPADWDRRYVLHRDGTISHAFRWVHTGRKSDIIAYTPKAPPQTPPDAGIGSDGAGEVERLRKALANTTAIVRLQNGNLYADINEILAQADAALATQPGDGGRW